MGFIYSLLRGARPGKASNARGPIVIRFYFLTVFPQNNFFLLCRTGRKMSGNFPQPTRQTALQGEGKVFPLTAADGGLMRDAIIRAVKGSDSPVLIPNRHSFLKNRHGFCCRIVVFTSETEIREWHNSSLRSRRIQPAGFQPWAMPENLVKCPDFLRTGMVLRKTGMVSWYRSDFTTVNSSPVWYNLDNDGKDR